MTRWLARIAVGSPALAHFALAVAIGLFPIALVATGVLPKGFDQLGALSASAAGLLLAGAIGGRTETIALLRRGLRWRAGFGWWAFVLAFPPVVSWVTIVLGAKLGGPAADFSRVGSLGSLIGLLVFLSIFAGVGEEFGWRGYALPRTQARHNALVAALIVGGLHTLWHTPLFFIPGISQYDVAQQAGFWPAFLGYGGLVLALGVQMAWLFNNTGGSVLTVAIYHGCINAWNGYLDIYRGQMAGVWVYTGLMVVASLVIVVTFGAEHLSRRTPREVVAGDGGH